MPPLCQLTSISALILNFALTPTVSDAEPSESVALGCSWQLQLPVDRKSRVQLSAALRTKRPVTSARPLVKPVAPLSYECLNYPPIVAASTLNRWNRQQIARTTPIGGSGTVT